MSGVRIWSPNGDPSVSFNDQFNSVSLYLGPQGGTVSLASSTPAVTTLPLNCNTAPIYPNGTNGGDAEWQLDFPVAKTMTGGGAYSFGILPDGKPDSGYFGYGESYYMLFVQLTRTGLSSGYPNDGGTQTMHEFDLNGSLDPSYGSWSMNSAWGMEWNGDYNIQVFGGALSTWSSATSGKWSDSTKWTGGPANAGDVACFSQAASGNVAITVDQPVTLSTLLLGNSLGTTTGGYSFSGRVAPTR